MQHIIISVAIQQKLQTVCVVQGAAAYLKWSKSSCIYITWFKLPNSDFSSHVAQIGYDPQTC